ncbi:hypothetical protein AB0F72_32220 [Actinoplanes sp. NPDC023936]|uniref:hypothetical protein n=1 Tax=Actinoplanes sp. NPDC023936 TaxID=3154910 RepID=UPI0033FE7C7D
MTRAGLLRHAFAVLVFLLMIGSGVDLLLHRAPGMGVPFVIAGVAGAAGSAATMLGRPRAARFGMLAGAAAATGAGWALAPDGWERGFVTGVGAVLGGLLAIFAVLSTPQPPAGRPRRPTGGSPHGPTGSQPHGPTGDPPHEPPGSPPHEPPGSPPHEPPGGSPHEPTRSG